MSCYKENCPNKAKRIIRVKITFDHLKYSNNFKLCESHFKLLSPKLQENEDIEIKQIETIHRID